MVTELQVSIPVDGVEDGDGLRDQRLGMKRHRRNWPVVMALRLRRVGQGDGMLGGDMGHAQDVLQARREDPHDQGAARVRSSDREES